MIFDHQHLLPGFRWCVRQRLFGSPGRQGRVFVPETHRQADAYTGALAGFAFEVDLAAHQLHQLFADGQPQSAAAVTPGDRVVGLDERLE